MIKKETRQTEYSTVDSWIQEREYYQGNLKSILPT